MPHVGTASGGEDLASSDEIKVFKDEGDEEENRSSENLTDLKSSLVTEGEEVRGIGVLLLCCFVHLLQSSCFRPPTVNKPQEQTQWC